MVNQLLIFPEECDAALNKQTGDFGEEIKMVSKASLLTDQDCIGIAKLDSAGPTMLAASPSGRDRKGSNLSVLIDFWKLRLGAGRLSLNEYFELRLFDEQ